MQMHYDPQENYLNTSQPVPASSMAALQRLSASIEVQTTTRSNSRASAYEDSDETGRPQYLTANCVVYSFFNGDLSTAIDDHFNRALNKRENSPDHQKSGNI